MVVPGTSNSVYRLTNDHGKYFTTNDELPQRGLYKGHVTIFLFWDPLPKFGLKLSTLVQILTV